MVEIVLAGSGSDSRVFCIGVLAGEPDCRVNLGRQGYQTYCPRIIEERRYRGRWRKLIKPLFPGYLFVQLERGLDNFAPIRSAEGVTGLVCFGGVPRDLAPGFIEDTKSQEDRGQGIYGDRRCWRPGDRVEIVEGALSGFRGLFLAESGDERVFILLSMLGRDNKVDVAPDDIVPA